MRQTPRNIAAELLPYLGPLPTAPGQAGALAYHRRILAALRTWPKGHDRPLYKALLKREAYWRPRAAGLDARWNRLGAHPGRTPTWLYAELYPAHPDFSGPLTDDDLGP